MPQYTSIWPPTGTGRLDTLELIADNLYLTSGLAILVCRFELMKGTHMTQLAMDLPEGVFSALRLSPQAFAVEMRIASAVQAGTLPVSAQL